MNEKQIKTDFWKDTIRAQVQKIEYVEMQIEWMKTKVAQDHVGSELAKGTIKDYEIELPVLKAELRFVQKYASRKFQL